MEMNISEYKTLINKWYEKAKDDGWQIGKFTDDDNRVLIGKGKIGITYGNDISYTMRFKPARLSLEYRKRPCVKNGFYAHLQAKLRDAFEQANYKISNSSTKKDNPNQSGIYVVFGEGNPKNGKWNEELLNKALEKMCDFNDKSIDSYFKVIEQCEQEFKKDAQMNHGEQKENIKNLLLNNHNIILHGAPGTGKTYLAKEIAKAMDCTDDEIGFVQFHQSFDYTDFVEGLRPKTGSDGKIGFEPKDGIFKKFCTKALKNLVDSNKDDSEFKNEIIWNERCKAFLEEYCFDGEKEIKFLETETYKKKFYIDDYNDNTISIAIPDNEKITSLSLNRKDLLKAFKTASHWDSVESFKDAIGKKYRHPAYYLLTIANKIGSMNSETKDSSVKPKKKHYVFIIDEINRGEMSKIFGELFYSIDPGYRVKYEDLNSGDLTTVQTQYANLQERNNDFDEVLGITNDEKDNHGHFFVPENVYIIGTMNDIDRSVECMDFAMRRRFAFKEIKAADTQDSMFKNSESWKNGKGDEIDVSRQLDKIKQRMNNLNNAILNKEFNLNSSYQIGGAYFLKFANYYDQQNDNATDAFKSLWMNHLEGVLREYLRGMDNVEGDKGLLKKLENAYNLSDLYKEDGTFDKGGKNGTQDATLDGGNAQVGDVQPEGTGA